MSEDDEEKSCARCKRVFPADQLADLPAQRLWVVMLGGLGGGLADELSEQYCPACRRLMTRYAVIATLMVVAGISAWLASCLGES